MNTVAMIIRTTHPQFIVLSISLTDISKTLDCNDQINSLLKPERFSIA